MQVREDIYSAFSPSNVAFFDLYKASKERASDAAAESDKGKSGQGSLVLAGGALGREEEGGAIVVASGPQGVPCAGCR